MRIKNSAAMTGRVKSKSKSAAFSISEAKEGGATESEAARITEMELERERRSWGLGKLGRDNFGNESWIGENLSFGAGGTVGDEVISALWEAMIMLAMAALLFLVGLYGC